MPLTASCAHLFLSPMLYVLALQRFLNNLKANPILRGISLPAATTSVRYSTYADDMSAFVNNNVEIDSICRYETVAGTKINRDKSVGL